jgi:hypothetical protein
MKRETLPLPTDEKPLELVTTRVSGGRSARAVALVVSAVLVGVVGFAIVNRPPPRVPPVAVGPTAAPVAVRPTPVPAPSPPRNQLEGNDGITGWAVVAQLPFSRARPPGQRVYSYAVAVPITGGLVRTALEPDLEDVFSASLDIALADVGAQAEIQIGRQWSQGNLTILETFGAWSISLEPLRRSRDGLVELLVKHVPPDTTPGVPGPIASGYTFTVLGRRGGTRLTLLLELVWPPAAQFADYPGPRGPGLFNRCRWEVGPQAAPPRGNEDEAGCLEI